MIQVNVARKNFCKLSVVFVFRLVTGDNLELTFNGMFFPFKKKHVPRCDRDGVRNLQEAVRDL